MSNKNETTQKLHQNVGQGFLHLLIYQTCMKTKFLAPTFIFQDI